jgi:hypothetical protein
MGTPNQYNNSNNAQDLLNSAMTDGQFGAPSMNAVMGLGLMNQLTQALGMNATDVDSVDPYLLTVILDDSTSIAWITDGTKATYFGHRPPEDLRGAGAKAMIDGRSMLIQTLKSSKRRSGIMIATYTLNRGLIHGFLTLDQLEARGLEEMTLPTDEQVRRIENMHYDEARAFIETCPKTVFFAYGGTPLYDRFIEGTAALVAKRTEFGKDCGVEPQGTVFGVTDGADRGSSNGTEPVVDAFTRAGIEVMFPMLMGIKNQHETVDFRSTGAALKIPPKFVFECDGDNRKNIMGAFQTATDTALSASQNAVSFSQTAMSGFMADDDN